MTPYNPAAAASPQAPGQGQPNPGFNYPAMQLPDLNDQQLGDLFQYQQLQGEKGNLGRQAQMAQSLREGAHKAAGHSTGIGAALAGVGDALDSYRAGKMLNTANAGLNAMPQRELDAQRAGYNQARKFKPYGMGGDEPAGPAPALEMING